MSSAGSIKINKSYLGFVVIVVVVGLVIWFFNAKHSVKEEPKAEGQQQSQQTPTTQKTSNQTAAQQPDLWTGTLKKSDSAAKGNLMLVTKARTVYIHTSRDYSSLIGQQVNVSYEGSFDNFVLGDITAVQPQ